jgi:adenosylhomocysteinase
MDISSMEKFLVGFAKSTNKSIAASAICRSMGFDESAAAQWGMRIDDGGNGFDSMPASASNEDPSLQSAKQRIDHARRHMPCVAALAEGHKKDGNVFKGARIAASLILEPKTAVFVLCLNQLGAEVELFCGASSVDQKVADELAVAGIKVNANSRNTQREDRAAALMTLDSLKPQLILDDGAGISRLMHMERPELLKGLIGISEETTCGVAALQEMEREGALLAPAMAVNDMRIKTLFDNAHGTGETVATTLMHLTGKALLEKTLQ